MVTRLQPIRIKLAYMLSTIYKYTSNRFKCRLATCLQQKTKWPPTVASIINWISRVDQTTRTRSVLQPVIQAYRVTPLLTYRSQVISSLTTPARNRLVIRLISTDTPDTLTLYHNSRHTIGHSRIHQYPWFCGGYIEHFIYFIERRDCECRTLWYWLVLSRSKHFWTCIIYNIWHV